VLLKTSPSIIICLLADSHFCWQLGPLEEQVEAAEKRAHDLDREITKVLSDLHKLDATKKNLTSEIDTLTNQIGQSEKKIEV